MKLLSTLLAIISFITVFTVNAQIQDVTWKELPSPVLTNGSVYTEKSSFNQLSNGKWYFTYYDESSLTLNIKRFNIDTQSWFTVHTQTLSGMIVGDVNTYIENGKLYVALTSDVITFNFHLWEMNTNENVTQLFAGEESSVSNGSPFDMVVVNDQLFMASTDGNGYYVIGYYNLTNTSYIDADTISVQSVESPDIAVDNSDNSLVIASVDPSDYYRIHKAPVQIPASFSPMGGTGGLTSSLYTGEAFGNFIRLVEKPNTSPEVVFVYNDGGNVNLYRVGIYNSSVTDMIFTNPDILGGAAVAQGGSNTFIGGFNNLAGGAEVWGVQPNGTKAAVAGNTNPAFYASQQDALATYYSEIVAPRAAVYYHIGTGNGTTPGNLKMTNTPPVVNPYDTTPGCVGTYSYVIEGLTFDDLDGDYVQILNGQFTSSQATVIDAATIYAYENANQSWDIELQGSTAGTSEITFDYTDGFDTITETVTIEVVDPALVSFTSNPVELCLNQNVADLNDYVDSTGGTFGIDDFVTDDGGLPFDTLDMQSFPYTSTVYYDYTDMNGCLVSMNAPLVIYENPSSTLNVTNTACGSNNGEIVATINSPNGTYNNYWNTGAQGVNTVSGLSPGTYYHNVIDEKGCIGVAQANVQASDINVSGVKTDPTCWGASDGSIELSINGANGPYNVLWSSGHSTPNIGNLPAGNYTATISNGNGCTVSHTITLTQPDPIVMDYSKTLPDCGQSNGAIEQMMIQGGNGNYSYQWTSGSTGQDMTGVPAGSYGLQVTDGAGCTATRAFNLNSLSAAGVNADVTKSVCGTSSGSIELDVFPATGESVTGITWSNGATTEDIYNLTPGVYTCQIEQTNGCTADFSWLVRARKPPRPDICIVTVDTSTTTNLIVWEKPAVNIFDIHHYNIYRETNVAGQFQLIDTVNYSNISVFNDVVASPLTRSWRYRISAVTSCGTESVPSSPHKTIHLVMNDMGNGDYEILWDNYEGFQYATYDLLRYTDADGEWVTIDAGIAYNALPNTTDTPTSTQGLDYMIKVVPPGGSCSATEGKAQDYNSSRSNRPRTEFNPGDGTGDPNNSLIKHENEDYAIAMYPNPTDGQFEIALYHDQSNINMSVEVVNIQGKVVYQGTIQNGVNYLDIGQVDSGVYFVNVEDGSTMERMKIVVK